jgi:branched-chain amino acid transport system substrate-binding protein
MLRPFRPPLLAALPAAAALLVGACGGGNGGEVDLGAVEALSSSSCADAEYGGPGKPDALVASDLPMQGDSAERSAQMVEAIRLALEQNDWTAGETRVAFQACDDSIEETGLWDESRCRENARDYAANPDLLGVIGTYNSGCAAEEIPILNVAGVAMISPGNTAVCLTEASPSCEEGQPDSLYPSGDRNYTRVVPNDAYQGAGLVEFAQGEGIASPFVLYAADDPTSTGQAENFRGAADELGLKPAGFESWNPEAKRYADLFEQVADSGADAVVLAGLTEQNGGQLIRAKVRALGPNDGDVPLIAFDGFAQQSTIDEAGPASAGMFASVPGLAPESLSGAGQELVEKLSGRVDGPVELYAPYAAEAAEVLLGAIAATGGDREAVAAAILETTRTGGILGSYEFEPSGDPSVGPVTVFLAADTFEPDNEVTPQDFLVAAARGEKTQPAPEE